MTTMHSLKASQPKSNFTRDESETLVGVLEDIQAEHERLSGSFPNVSILALGGKIMRAVERAKLEAQPKPQQSDEGLRIALRAFKLLYYPVCESIDPRGYSWQAREETLDYVKGLIDAALSQASAPVPTSGAVEVAQLLDTGHTYSGPDGVAYLDVAEAAAIIQQYGDAAFSAGINAHKSDNSEDATPVIRPALSTVPPAADGKLREALAGALAYIKSDPNFPKPEHPNRFGMIETNGVKFNLGEAEELLALAQPASGGGAI